MLVAKVSLVVPMPVASCTKDELQLEVKTTCTEALATLNLLVVYCTLSAVRLMVVQALGGGFVLPIACNTVDYHP